MKLTKSLCVIFLLTALIIFSGCSKKEQTCTVTEKDGVKIYRNNNVPTLEKIDFNPVKLFEVNSDSTEANHISYSDFDLIDFDSKGNIFIADWGTPKINKYNKDGKHEKTFVRSGKGPGEATNFWFLCIKNDTIYVSDRQDFSISMFNTEGEFLNRVQPEGMRFQMKPVGKNRFICKFFNVKPIEGRYEATDELVLLNNSFEPIKVLNKEVYYMDEVGLPDVWVYSTTTENRIYIPVNEKNIYKVKVFDHEGNLKEEIFKNYFSILFTDEEYKKMEHYVERTQQGIINRLKMKYKRAVVGIYNDKNGNILTHPAVDTSKGNTEGMYLDFFKDGVYLNSFMLKTDKPYYQCDFDTFIQFKGDRMYKYSTERNVLEAYEY